jgi:hypothetical protein
MPHQPIAVVIVETSLASRRDQSTKNKLIRKVTLTKMMWNDFSDIAQQELELVRKTEVETVVVNRIRFRSHDQDNHECKKHNSAEENPVNGFFLVV